MVGSGVLRSVTTAQGWPDDRPGGLNRYVADLHASLPGAGVDDALVVFSPAAAAPGRVVRAGSEDARLVRRLAAVAAGARRAAAPGADLLVTHFALYGLGPSLVPPLAGLPHVAHFHGPWAAESAAQDGGTARARAAQRAKGLLERVHLRRADAVVTASRAFADLVVRLHGLPAARVHPVHPGVDLQRFHPLAPAEREAARAGLGVAPGEHLVVTARRLVPRMGLEELVGAWAAAPGARLVVLGEGPLRPALQRAADAGARGVSLRGRVDDAELVRWYQAADLVVVPSVALEGFGLVVLEALACGTPVVASAVGGLSEVLAQLGGELLLDPRDAAAWRSWTSPSAAGRLPTRERCRALAEAHGRDAFAAAVAAVYRDVSARGAR